MTYSGFCGGDISPRSFTLPFHWLPKPPFFMICAGDAIGRDYCAHVLRPGVHHVITVMEMKCKQAFLLYILVVWDFALYKYKEKRQKWLLVAAMILLFFFISWNNNCLFDFSWIKLGTGFFFNSRAIYYWPR